MTDSRMRVKVAGSGVCPGEWSAMALNRSCSERCSVRTEGKRVGKVSCRYEVCQRSMPGERETLMNTVLPVDSSLEPYSNVGQPSIVVDEWYKCSLI